MDLNSASSLEINNKSMDKLNYKFMYRPQNKQSINLVYSSNTKKGDIYIGNLDAAQSPQVLKQHNIGAVISAARGTFLQHSKEILPNYLYIPAYDHQQFDISVYFDKTYDFIQKASKKTNILVHCRAGISRSATIVIAYFMRKQKKSWIEAYKQIKQFRPIIQPNDGFLRQLKNYSDIILKENNKIQNVREGKPFHKKGVSCGHFSHQDAKQNRELKADQKHMNSKQIQITKKSSKSVSKVRHRHRLSQIMPKRQSIQWAIHY